MGVHAPSVPALTLFRNGHDTAAIAKILKITEPQALKQVSSQRSAALGLSDPYPVPTTPWPQGQIAYQGR